VSVFCVVKMDLNLIIGKEYKEKIHPKYEEWQKYPDHGLLTIHKECLIKLIINKILIGLEQLESKTNLRLCNLINDIRDKVNNPNELINIWMANSAKPDGADTFNECLWDTDIVIDGKNTRLNELFGELSSQLKENNDL
jgi:hypothetical protein